MTLPAKQKRELESKLQAYVGKPIGPPQVGRDPVNVPMIRQWCDAMGDGHPAYTDPVAAERSVHRGLVAPPTMLQAWILPGFEMSVETEAPRDEQQALHKLLSDHGYTSVVATNCEQGYARYLRPGDELSAETVVESISEEKATALGIGYFIDTLTTFRDQNGDEVGWMKFRVLKFIPQQPAQTASSADAAPAKPQRIRPLLGHDNAWWWEIVNQGQLPIQKCNGCGALLHPPRPMCGHCQSTDLSHVIASGKGEVYSFVVMHHPQFPGYEYPLVAALVELEEGTRLVSNLVGCAPEDVHIGLPVRVCVERVDDELMLPVFRPAS
ncbi:MAG: bifunctional MaoC family dehydratase/OB-fold nucleic acid binding domain-containing protein [Deltaproteobacteria bacterium]|nr:MAG: bifunctional MaoC family dehydratase/OB-fold nucleic acid binding domain-containing protein [Deltaproteobacteria bacterium]